ncbi:MAG: hypothetical protein JRF33_09285 [Deltaproteobacteria bacterium]|nr:hypothetical protein [Deltaproteobacteria bacterium]
MFHFLYELIRFPAGGLFFVLAAFLILFQLVILGVALFAEGRGFARRWSTALSLAVPLSLGLAMLAGVQLCRAQGLSSAAWADPSEKAMSLAMSVAGNIMLQLAGGFALAFSGLLSAVACGLSMRAGRDEALAPKASFAGLGLMAALAALIFGAGLAWRAMEFNTVFSALAAVAPGEKIRLLSQGIAEMSGLMVPALLAAGLLVLGAVWRIRDTKRAGKAALTAGVLSLVVGGAAFWGTRPHAADACVGSQEILNRSGGNSGHRPMPPRRLDPVDIDAEKPLKPGPELSLGRDELILDDRPLLDLREEETEGLEKKLGEALRQQAERERVLRERDLGLAGGQALIFLLDQKAEGAYLARTLKVLIAEKHSQIQLATKRFDKLNSAVYGPMPLVRWAALELRLGTGDESLWPTEKEDGQAWAERIAKAAKAGVVEIAPPAPNPPSALPEPDKQSD